MKLQKFLILFVFLSFISCSSESGQDYSMKMDMQTAPEMAEEEYAGQANESVELEKTSALQSRQSSEPVKIEQKLIKTAHVSIEVEDYQETKPEIDQLVKESGGYISGENEQNQDWRIYNEITIRVPKENFDSLLDAIAALAKTVEQKNILLQDVTEEYVDIETRLENKRKVEERYREILKQAKTIQEILQVEEHLRQIREEIESKQGRKKFLDNRINLSTITLTVNQYEERVYRGFWGKVVDALEGGWKGILSFLIGFLYLWPLWLLVVLVVYLIVRWRKKRRLKKLIETRQKNT